MAKKDRIETFYKRPLTAHLRTNLPGFVVQRIEQIFTHGSPDISVDGNKKNTWLEVKHATPGFGSKGIQELTMLRLDLATHARYVVYYEVGNDKRTYIVPPRDIGKDPEEWDNLVIGINHDFILDYIKERHK